MKIVYCIHGTFNSGGMEKIIINKANYLVEKGFKVFIITTEQKGRASFFGIHPSIECFDLGINYEDENNTSFIRKFISFQRKQRIHKERLRDILYRIKADIVISTFGNEVNFLYSIKDGSRKLLEIHFSKFFRNQLDRKGIWKIVDKYRSYVDEKKVKKYDKFVVLTHEDKSFWKNQNNITVIPNFISIQKNKSELKNKRAIAVGRLSYQKGYERMIKAWSIVEKQHPEWILDIYGNGENKEELSELISELGLNGKIRINKATSKIEQEYADASVFLLSSRYEGLPMVLLEAMSFGLAIVSYDCKCGPKDIITNYRNGILVKEGDIENFAKEIINVIENQDLRNRLGQNAGIDIEKYSIDVIMKQWIDLFINTIKE